MSENKIIGIVDEPISSAKSDALKIGLHANSLVRFIENTTTPMTVGIQGEWGSGKTSLLNSIKGTENLDINKFGLIPGKIRYLQHLKKL